MTHTEQVLPATAGDAHRIRTAPRPRIPSPAKLIGQRPWGFLGVMAAAGFAGGLLLMLKSARKAAQILTTVVKGVEKAEPLAPKKW